MRKTITILLLIISISACSQTTWGLRNDSLFIIRGLDSVYYSPYMFFDYILGLKSNVIATQILLDAKQPTLVSATNIKTINGGSILGSGDLVVSGAAAFSSITGQPTDNTNLATALNGKANVTTIGIPVYARVTGSNVTTTGQALVNITGLSVALTTNAIYEFEAVLSVSTSAVTTGTAYGVNYSVAGATVESSITGSSTSTATRIQRIIALNTATSLYLATSAQTGGMVIKGIITTGANAGNFTVSHLKLTSGTSTVFINSFLKCIRIL